MNMLKYAVGMAGVGGALSWGTGGGFLQGATAGAFSGLALATGAGMAGKAYMHSGIDVAKSAPRLAKAMGSNFSTGVRDFANFTTTRSGRRTMYGAGAALGGMAFGGNNRRARGFNTHRGNRFGR